MTKEQARRVLVLQQYALPRTEGGATRHVELFTRLKRWSALIIAGDINLYTRKRFVHSSPGFVTVHTTGHSGNGPARIVSWMSYVWGAVWKSFRMRKIDVVFASSPQMLVPLAGWFIAKLRRAEFVVEIRDLWPRSLVEFGFLKEGSLLHRVLVGLEKFFYNRADRIIVVTTGWEEHFTSLGVNLEKVIVITNGAEPEDFRSGLDRDQARKQLDLKPEDFVAIFAGAHGPKDGLDVVLDAAKLDPNITILLAGDGQEKVRLKERAAAEGIGNVRFVDPVPKDQLADLFAACDVGLHIVAPVELFKQAMSPNKLYDYLAAGLPVISNAGGAIEKLLALSGGGISASAEGREPDAPRVLADAIGELRSLTPEQRLAFGTKGREYMEQYASRTVMAERLESTLDEIVTR